jgi:hypothetical protein
LKKTITINRSGGVAQGVDSEFKSNIAKKKKEKKKKNCC